MLVHDLFLIVLGSFFLSKCHHEREAVQDCAQLIKFSGLRCLLLIAFVYIKLS